MTFHVIIGAGAVAVRTALLLAEDGEPVKIVSRSGGGPDHPLVEKVAADAKDADRMTELLTGAATLFNCAMPPYDRWPQEFPDLAQGLLTAVLRTGVPYVMLGNLYAYGLVEGPVHPGLPLLATGPKGSVRARVWEQASASGAKVTEVRASQFYGAGAMSVFNLMVQPGVLAGALALVPQELDLAHSYSSVGDTARTWWPRAATSGCGGVPGTLPSSPPRSGSWPPGWPSWPVPPHPGWRS